MRVTFLWWTFEGYMTAGWQALAKRPGIEMRILALSRDPASPAPFDESLLNGLSCTLLSVDELTDIATIIRLVRDSKPDVIIIPGWFNRGFIRALRDPALASVPVVMAVDTPRRPGSLRQFLGRFWMRPLLRRTSAFVVAGERAYQLCRYLGVDEKRLHRGMYTFDHDLFAPCLTARLKDRWPRRFLFVGRYVRDKGIHLLAEAARLYRQRTPEPWSFACCGSGPGVALVREAAFDDLGFLQPPALAAALRDSGCLLMPSLVEPWGVALAEGCSAGLPVICSEACGASVELVRPFHNGLLIPTGDAETLSDALLWIDAHADLLPDMGRRSQALAAAFAPEMWAERWERALRSAIACPAAGAR